MTTLSEIYNTRIMTLAANTPATPRLVAPQASATAHSKLCGSTVSLDIDMEGDQIVRFGQTVKACLLGQAAAAVVAAQVVGSTASEVRAVADAMRRMLKEGGAPPGGRWSDLAVLEPVKDYRARHASTLLVFDALERAIDQIEAGRREREGPLVPATSAAVSA